MPGSWRTLAWLVLVVLEFELLVRLLVSLPAISSAIEAQRGEFAPPLRWTCPETSSTGPVAYDPVLGWAPVARGPHDRDIDARGTRRVPGAEATGRPVIVVLVDSFSWADEVRRGESWPARLQALWPEARVVNLAVSGYGPEQFLLRWRSVRDELDADLVVVAMPTTDLRRVGRDFFFRPRPFARMVGDSLVWSPPSVPTPTERCRAMRWTSWAAVLLTRLVIREPGAREDAGRIAGEVLSELSREVREQGAAFVPLWLPMAYDLDPGQVPVRPDVEPPLPWLDPSPALAEVLARDGRLLEVSHYTTASHEALARWLLPVLQTCPGCSPDDAG